jgi:hypothetical protein
MAIEYSMLILDDMICADGRRIHLHLVLEILNKIVVCKSVFTIIVVINKHFLLLIMCFFLLSSSVCLFKAIRYMLYTDSIGGRPTNLRISFTWNKFSWYKSLYQANNKDINNQEVITV